jgi:hypothetical protein
VTLILAKLLQYHNEAGSSVKLLLWASNNFNF